jgi:hypothetical protein
LRPDTQVSNASRVWRTHVPPARPRSRAAGRSGPLRTTWAARRERPVDLLQRLVVGVDLQEHRLVTELERPVAQGRQQQVGLGAVEAAAAEDARDSTSRTRWSGASRNCGPSWSANSQRMVTS